MSVSVHKLKAVDRSARRFMAPLRLPSTKSDLRSSPISHDKSLSGGKLAEDAGVRCYKHQYINDVIKSLASLHARIFTLSTSRNVRYRTFRGHVKKFFCHKNILENYDNCKCIAILGHPPSINWKYKKLISRWDSERELSLRRHRARATKYNRLVHKFRHIDAVMCCNACLYQIQWNSTI